MGVRQAWSIIALALAVGGSCTQVPDDAVYACGENGLCPAPSTCREGVCVSFTSECVAESNTALCADAGYVCGELQVTDSCGRTKQVTCGVDCGAPALCNQGACCTPRSAGSLCAAFAITCGPATVTECGAALSIFCGACDAGASCTGSGCDAGACVSESNTAFCARTGIECNIAPTAVDNCGVSRANVNCGAGDCPNGRTCGADGGNFCP